MFRFCILMVLLMGIPPLSGVEATTTRTIVEIVGADFHLNGRPTYEGRHWQGHRVEGLLGNLRMVQAVFDDLNPETAVRWAYPDTKTWDPERNVAEFIAAMPSWREHGLLAITVNLQGGSPEGYSAAQPWNSSGFHEDGTLRPAFTRRLTRVLEAADRLGMVVILGYFYFGQDQRLRDEAAVLRATDEATQWILAGGWRNVLIEIANETGHPDYDHAILQPERISELIKRVQGHQRDGHRLKAGTSGCGGVVPRESIVQASDFILLHGNGVHNPEDIGHMVQRTRRVPGYRPMPILFNEDDHEGFDQPQHNFGVATAHHASWGWFDYRRKGEAHREGYQSLPIDWRSESARKRAFFAELREITEGSPTP